MTYRGTLNTESLEPSYRISPRPKIMLKILYFKGYHQFFQISLCPYSFISRGGITWDREDNFSKFIDRRYYRTASHWSTWAGCFFLTFILLKGNFCSVCISSECIECWINFQNIYTFTYQKALLHTLFCLLLKLSKAFSVSSRSKKVYSLKISLNIIYLKDYFHFLFCTPKDIAKSQNKTYHLN